MEDMHIHLKKGVNNYEIMKEYTKKCIELGRNKVLFLDHGNRISKKHTPVLNNEEVIDEFFRLIKKLKEEFNTIDIYSGIEVDYSSDVEFVNNELKLMNKSFDYILGSVHGIKYLTKEEYYKANIDLIDVYPINILCHLRLYEDYLNYSNLIEEIVKKCSEKNIKIEINTSERALWTFEQFLYMMNLLRKYDVKYTIGSDAHAIEEIGTNYGKRNRVQCYK